MTSQTPLLDVHNISKQFNGSQAVDKVSFQVFSGEIVALLGANGAGKTTTLSICEGLLEPDSGTVKFLDEPVTVTHSDHIHVNMGIMMQHHGGYPTAKVKEILALYAQFYVDPCDPQWLMSILGLSALQNSTFRNLSGGQQKRLSLACAIIGKPRLVILDEPSAGLDFEGQNLIMHLIKSMARDGVGIVLTTHSLAEIENLADRIIVLHQGKIIGEGDKSQFHESTVPQQLYFSTKQDIVLTDMQRSLPEGYTLAQENANTYENAKYSITGNITPALMHTLTAYALEHNILLSEITLSHKEWDDLLNLVQHPRQSITS